MKCVFCESEENLVEVKDTHICEDCQKEIKEL